MRQGQRSRRPSRVPFTFVENRGQTDAIVHYLGSGPGFRAWFEAGEVSFRKGDVTVQMQFENALRDPARARTMYAKENPLEARANFLIGSDPSRWRTDLPLFSTLVYDGVWPGVKLRYRAEVANASLKARVRGRSRSRSGR